MTDQSIPQDAICYQWFKQRLLLSFSKRALILYRRRRFINHLLTYLTLANGHRLKRTPAGLSVLVRHINL